MVILSVMENFYEYISEKRSIITPKILEYIRENGHIYEYKLLLNN